MYTNEYYDLGYDPDKNQINWKVKGFWRSASVVPDMEKNWDAVLKQARKPGFNILADLTEMKPPPADVAALHAKVQQKILTAGGRKVAAIIGSALTEMSVQHIGKVSGINQMIGNFRDRASAQAWLDEK